MRIRAAVPGDGPAIIKLVEGLADYEKLPRPDEGAKARLLEALFGEAAKLEMLVAERDETVVAYAAFFTTFSTFLAKPTLFLEDLFVAPEARREGIGGALMRDLRSLADERGCGRFEWTVLDWNTGAQDFYRGLGADILEDWRFVRIVL